MFLVIIIPSPVWVFDFDWGVAIVENFKKDSGFVVCDVVVVWLWFSSDYNTYPSLDFDFDFD